MRKHIFTIRQALGDAPTQPQFLETLPRRGYRFLAAVRTSPVAASPVPGPSAPGTLVGRTRALGELRGHLQLAVRGQRQLVLVTGDPGIGKTALVDAFQRQAAMDVQGLRLARGQCIEGYGGKEAYYPMLDALGHWCRGGSGDAVVQTLAAHAPTWLVQFPALVTREHRALLQRELLGATRQRMVREICEALETLTAARPLLLMLEDLQWVDPATVDLLAALARRRGPAKLMLLATSRPMDGARTDHPLQALSLLPIGVLDIPDVIRSTRHPHGPILSCHRLANQSVGHQASHMREASHSPWLNMLGVPGRVSPLGPHRRNEGLEVR